VIRTAAQQAAAAAAAVIVVLALQQAVETPAAEVAVRIGGAGRVEREEVVGCVEPPVTPPPTQLLEGKQHLLASGRMPVARVYPAAREAAAVAKTQAVMTAAARRVERRCMALARLVSLNLPELNLQLSCT
jgi:hypothetical protein